MKQRLGIAQALLGNPELVILDEPTSGLDPQGIKEVRELIQRLSRDRHITVFLSSHLLGEIEQTATSMAIINLGTLVVQGRVADLLEAGEHVVRFDASPADQALRLLSASRLTGKVERNGVFLECTVPREQVSAVNRMLVEAGIEVRAILPRRSLEEYFLAITEGASDVAVPVSGTTGQEGSAP
jgi:ABC-2 type transport system ATP-binding protein